MSITSVTIALSEDQRIKVEKDILLDEAEDIPEGTVGIRLSFFRDDEYGPDVNGPLLELTLDQASKLAEAINELTR